MSLFLCAAGTGPATAQPPPPPTVDVLGLYSAPDETGLPFVGYCHNPVTGPYEIYIVASGVTDPVGIYGWECRVIVPTDLFFTGVTYVGQAINVGVAPDFMVGLSSPLPLDNGFMHLASISFFVVSGTCDVWLYLEPAIQPSLPGQMVYASGADPDVLTPFAWSSGSPVNPVFAFNRNPIFPAVEPVTWGAVKSLHR